MPDAGPVTIGRSEACTIFLNALSVSREHCRLIRVGEDFEIEDLGSRVGTVVDGTKITSRTRLRDGSRIQLGEVAMTFRLDEIPDDTAAQRGGQGEDLTLVGRGSAGAGDPSAPPRGRGVKAGRHSGLVRVATTLSFGRSDDCDVVLDSPFISRKHSQVCRSATGLLVRDLASSNGTFVNGVRVGKSTLVEPGDAIRIGPYLFKVTDAGLQQEEEKDRLQLVAHGLGVSVRDRSTGQPLHLLKDITFVVEPHEFIAILGPSGSGKSTLMAVASGRRVPTVGRVLANEENLHQSLEYYRRAIGYVPQRDIVHMGLTVRQALTYAARLRLPIDTSSQEIARSVDRVLQTTELAERANVRVGDLSGGQIKRVNLGVELISDPTLLLLDEATSGLDAGTERRMMELFRRLAHSGKTVLCITHNVENVEMCDKVVVLSEGRLVFYGPPPMMLRHFRVGKPSEVYGALEKKSADEWATDFNRTGLLAESSKGRMSGVSAEPAKGRSIQEGAAQGQTGAWVHQWRVLVERGLRLLVEDRRNLAILLGQAPIIAALILLIYSGYNRSNPSEAALKQKMVVFLMTVSAIWFGCINSAREIVKELPIYLRERSVGTGIGAYLCSKVAILACLCGLQCLILVVVLTVGLDLRGNVVQQWLTLLVVSISGLMMGLCVSSLVASTDRAVGLVPILLIPQVILAGAIQKLEGVTEAIAFCTMPSYWGFDALKATLARDVRGLLDLKYPWSADMTAMGVMTGAFALVAYLGLRRKDRQLSDR